MVVTKDQQQQLGTQQLVSDSRFTHLPPTTASLHLQNLYNLQPDPYYLHQYSLLYPEFYVQFYPPTYTYQQQQYASHRQYPDSACTTVISAADLSFIRDGLQQMILMTNRIQGNLENMSRLLSQNTKMLTDSFSWHTRSSGLKPSDNVACSKSCERPLEKPKTPAAMITEKLVIPSKEASLSKKYVVKAMKAFPSKKLDMKKITPVKKIPPTKAAPPKEHVIFDIRIFYFQFGNVVGVESVFGRVRYKLFDVMLERNENKFIRLCLFAFDPGGWGDVSRDNYAMGCFGGCASLQINKLVLLCNGTAKKIPTSSPANYAAPSRATQLQADVRGMFFYAFDRYIHNAFPLEELMPLICKRDCERFGAAVEMINTYVQFNIDKPVSVFETTTADNSLDYAANFSHLLRVNDPIIFELMKLYSAMDAVSFSFDPIKDVLNQVQKLALELPRVKYNAGLEEIFGRFFATPSGIYIGGSESALLYLGTRHYQQNNDEPWHAYTLATVFNLLSNSGVSNSTWNDGPSHRHTGSGDVLALDVDLGQLKWRVIDCHLGGVNANSNSGHNSCIYTAGMDGMVCQIDCTSGKVLGECKASIKTISALSMSPDGKLLATAYAQLKFFKGSNNKKTQKISGQPTVVLCMVFSEDGNYILSSAGAGKSIVIWKKIDSGQNESAACILSMDHPAIFLDTMCSDVEGVYVLAISKMGICLFWHATPFEELQNIKPSKISLATDS